MPKTLVYLDGGNTLLGEFDYTEANTHALKMERAGLGDVGYMVGTRYSTPGKQRDYSQQRVYVFFREAPIDLELELHRRRRNGLVQARWFVLPKPPMRLWSVAVRPTPEEITRYGLIYDKDYYEDREKRIAARTASIAVAEYCNHPDLRNWLCGAERSYARATEIAHPRHSDSYIIAEALKREQKGVVSHEAATV